MSSFIRLLANIMQMLKRYEFKQNHYEWIKSVKPTLDPVISAQIHQELGMTEAEIENCHAVRNEAHSAVNLLLKDDGILVIPTTTEPPPKLGRYKGSFIRGLPDSCIFDD